jgi:c-di-GMP-binding flagellar brake protein YcgR
MGKERRKHTRVPLCFHAELSFADGEIYDGLTENISFGGAYIVCEGLADTLRRDSCTVTIISPSDDEPLRIPIKCRIVRAEQRGVGIRFISMDINDYHKFKKLMVYNSSEPDTLLAELEKDPGLAVA